MCCLRQFLPFPANPGSKNHSWVLQLNAERQHWVRLCCGTGQSVLRKFLFKILYNQVFLSLTNAFKNFLIAKISYIILLEKCILAFRFHRCARFKFCLNLDSNDCFFFAFRKEKHIILSKIRLIIKLYNLFLPLYFSISSSASKSDHIGFLSSLECITKNLSP